LEIQAHAETRQTCLGEVGSWGNSSAPAARARATEDDLEDGENREGFLWEGRAAANGGSCHVNWRRVCRSTSLGGLGIQDLERNGLVLRLWWQWLSRTDRNRAWTGLDLKFSSEEKDLFFASTTMALGNSQSAKLWEDRWINGWSVRKLAPQLYAVRLRP
jgi:hypothetical protein